MQIGVSIVLIPLSGVDISASSKDIRLSSEASKVEVNDKVESEEELQPVGLPPSQEFGCCKVLQVLVVSDDVNQSCRTLKIVVLGPKSLMDSKEFLVMSAVVELWSRQSLGIVDNRPSFLIRTMNG